MTELTKGCSPHIADPAAIQLSLLQVHPRDNVLVVLQPLASGQALIDPWQEVQAKDDIQPGHKVALQLIKKGEAVIKYGYPIGVAQQDSACF